MPAIILTAPSNPFPPSKMPDAFHPRHLTEDISAPTRPYTAYASCPHDGILQLPISVQQRVDSRRKVPPAID